MGFVQALKWVGGSGVWGFCEGKWVAAGVPAGVLLEAPVHQFCERPVGRWRAVGATGSWMPVPGSLDPLTSTTEELCGCLGRGSTGPSSRRAGRGPGHKTRVAAPAGEPGASHKGRLGGRLRQQWQSRRAVGDGKLCRAGQELRRNVRAVHEQHSQLFRALAQFSSSGNAVSDSSAAPARAYPPPAPLTSAAWTAVRAASLASRPLGEALRRAGP